MIYSVVAINHLGDVLAMELSRPEESGFAIQSITGISAGSANVNMTDYASTDGGVYNSSRLGIRNIVIKFRFIDKYSSIEELRHLSYEMFALKKSISLLFITDTRSVIIDGVVEKNEPEIFSSTEGSDISILCADPYFYSYGADSMETTFSEVIPMFEFVYDATAGDGYYSNESLTEPLTEFSLISDTASTSIYYDGDAEVGVAVSFHLTGEVGDITFYNSTTNEYFTIDVSKVEEIVGNGFTLGNGDDIILRSTTGNKSVTLIHAGISTNILPAMTPGSDWIQLVKGWNTIGYYDALDSKNLVCTVNNQVKYSGV